MNTKQHETILYRDLSYLIQGCCFDIRKEYGPGQKESVYVNLLKEYLESKNLKVEKEKSISIHSAKSGKVVGIYRPDLVVNDLIPIEVKSTRFITSESEKQLYHYLRNSKYELGYLVNFSTKRLFLKRIIYTNDRKPYLKLLSCLFVFCFVLFSVVVPLAQAAELSLNSSQDTYSPNEIFKVEVRLKVESGENVTALEANIHYNNQDLQAKEFLTGNSILTFVDQPKIIEKEELVSFSGIIPGGYSGRLPGDPGLSNLLGTIVFEVLKTPNPDTKIEILTNSQILLNEGQSDNSPVFGSLIIKINPQEVVFNPLNELEQTKETDKIPPEEFKPEISQINNQYFLVFNTQDKQSGVDHYEIHESIRKRTRIDTKDWVEAESPYLLKDQELKSYIYVKAVDKAGNERITFIGPKYPIKWYEKWWIWGIIILGIIVLIIMWVIRKFLWRKLNTK